MDDNAAKLQKCLFEQTFSEPVETIEALKAHASDRQIFRLSSHNYTFIGVSNEDQSENKAFIEFTRHFEVFGLPVPKIYAVSEDCLHYLQQDLGEETLMDLLISARTEEDPFPAEIEALYLKAVSCLPRFQIEAGKTINYDFCCRSRAFDRVSMISDMNSFQNNFLKHVLPDADTTALEGDYNKFADLLSAAESNFFMYRDFQARNIMICRGEPYFIDYQGGRLGPLQYDLVSLLYQSRTKIPEEVRARLLSAYIATTSQYVEIDIEKFYTYYYGFVFLRLMQVLGVYGKMGIVGGKEYFLNNIPYALDNLRQLLEDRQLPEGLGQLEKLFTRLTSKEVGEIFNAKL